MTHIPAGGRPTSQDSDPATHTTEQATVAPGTDPDQRQRNPRRVNVHTQTRMSRLRPERRNVGYRRLKHGSSSWVLVTSQNPNVCVNSLA
jgi:hypothetical protein